MAYKWMPPSNRKIRARLSSEGGNIPRPFRPYAATPSTLSAFLSSSLLSSFSILFSFPPSFFFIFLNDTRDPTALRNRAPFMAEFVTLNWRSCATTTTTTNDPRGFRTVKFRGFFFYGLIYWIVAKGRTQSDFRTRFFVDLWPPSLDDLGVY